MKFEETDGCISLKDDNGVYCGKITYVKNGKNVMVIDHTIVEPEHQGKGYAGMLLEKMVEKAKNEKKTIVPLCSYARVKFENNKEYQEVEEK